MPRAKLIVIGTGFGAFSLIKSIDVDLYEINVVSPRNHFIFTPLLPSTTVGTIEFRSIIEPIRSARKGLVYYEARCTGIDPAARSIVCRHEQGNLEFSLTYDVLVIAAGGASNTYGVPGVAEHALFLREVSDARLIRQRIIDSFERASAPALSEGDRRGLLRFIIVGGGPTGVEFAAELHDFLMEDVCRAFGDLMKDVSIVLVEAGGVLLNTFDAALSAYTMKHFLRQKIDVRVHTTVTRLEQGRAYLNDGQNLAFGLLVWSAGLGPSPLIQSLPFSKNAQQRLIVDEYLKIVGQSDLYAIGDCATFRQKNLPATGQVAQQEGKYLGRLLNRKARGNPVKPFRYKNLGMLAYIGSNEALADLESVKGHGFATWLFWRSAYLTRLVSLKNKILVIFDWSKALIFGRDISRF